MKTLYSLIITGFLSVITIQTALSQPGSLDPSFGTGGITVTPFGTGVTDYGFDVAIQGDGKIIVAGQTYLNPNSDFGIMRYNTNGTLDNSFGTGGKVSVAVSAGLDIAYNVAIQSDGKILMAGCSEVIAGNKDFSVVRFNADGSLDNTFGSGGKVTTGLGTNTDWGYCIAVQPDGKILVGGWVRGTTYYDYGLVRYNSNGTLDNTFGSGGKVTTNIGTGDDHPYSIAIQSDGKIIVGGNSDNGAAADDFSVVRYNANGTLDNTFGSGGKVMTAIGSSYDGANQVLLQSDGKIVLVGQSYTAATDNDIALVRYNSNGTLDNTFGTNGKVVTVVGSYDEYGMSAALQTDGKIVVSGYTWVANNDIALLRYNTNGTLDNTFGTAGKVTTAIAAASDFGNAVAIQADGKIIVGGHSGSDFAVLRYISGVVSVDELNNEISFSIFPNPAHSTFSIALSEQAAAGRCELEIYDATGRQVFSETLNAKLQTMNTDISPGIYLVKVKSGEKIFTQKLLIQAP